MVVHAGIRGPWCDHCPYLERDDVLGRRCFGSRLVPGDHHGNVRLRKELWHNVAEPTVAYLDGVRSGIRPEVRGT